MIRVPKCVPITPLSNRTDQKIRLLLVDDHTFVAIAVAEFFDSVADIELIAQARSIQEAVIQTSRHQPDVVLLDRRLPDGDGIGAIKRLSELSPHSRVLVFTGAADRAVADRVAKAGGAGIVLKTRPDELVGTIRRVAAGHDAFDVDLPSRDLPSRPGGLS